ncbi:MAG: glycerate kinase [Anaerolineales bacterium]|jgi:glycerate 2-kinase
MQPDKLSCPVTQDQPWGQAVARILAAALQAVDPADAVARHLTRHNHHLQAGEHSYDLENFERIWLVGAGKAGAPMAVAAARILEGYHYQGLIVVKEGYAEISGRLPTGLEILEAGHPLPDERGVTSTRRIRTMLEEAGPDDLVICLISGGGSALLTDPAGDLTLTDLQELTRLLLASGATINEINCLRKHLDAVKGGGLVRMAAPAHLLTLILSDVVGDPLDVIASGPTVPDTTTFTDAWNVLERYELLDQCPPRVLRWLENGKSGTIAETLKPGDDLFERVSNLVIGSNRLAAEAAILQSQVEGFHPLLLTTYLQGEARQAGVFLAAIARQISSSDQPIPRPACVVIGGETTVTMRGDGLGGRNQELALGAVRPLDRLPNIALVTLATDGGDGPTDAAGAVVTGETLSQAKQLNLDLEDFLGRNDSYHFFEKLGGLLKPGPTMTNVNDLTFLFAF